MADMDDTPDKRMNDILDEKGMNAHEKETMIIRKTWYLDFDTMLVKIFNRLFRKKEI
jgi:hypothetical protein